ncbi:hypothetical protein [Aeromicrobium sp.]|uniref:arsenate reductase/protein-tyrosine-phosphatase family protein n=1 Tax=Aeromicrobium sp. TaxID=1871063 RepID=UPI0019BFAD2D|nr:hypothetical protein [Aeromicrobium sp.]MBC7632271.1 low molecular weight phosphatase family protein [Aeromicrobium sp.]
MTSTGSIDWSSAAAGHRVLVVCTGNVCRSPYLAAMLSLRLAERGRDSVVVGSAGTGALVGEPIAAPMRRILADAGAETAGAARQIDRSMLEQADLVITADRAHRSAVVQLAPGALRRTFTARQAARLLTTVEMLPSPDEGPAKRLAALLAAGRGQHGPSAGSSDDVPDPWGGTDDLYAACVRTMEPPLVALADALARL